MAKATIKIIPRQEQLEEFNYSADIQATWNYLATVFYKPNVECEVGLAFDSIAKTDKLVLWFDGIAVPLYWCSVTALTEAEEELILEYL